MSKSTFTYVTYIRTTPERLWAALTTPEFIRQYWFGMACESDWTTGSSWTLKQPDGTLADVGELLEVVPQKRLVIKWRVEWDDELKAEGHSLCTMEVDDVSKGAQTTTRLSITHSSEKAGSRSIEMVSGGWPRILSNLKSLLETGEVVLEPA